MQKVDRLEEPETDPSVGRFAVISGYEPVRQDAVDSIIVVFLAYGVFQFKSFLQALVRAGPVHHLGEQVIDDGVRFDDDVMQASTVFQGSRVA